MSNNSNKSNLVIFLDMDETLIYSRDNPNNERTGKTNINECEVLMEYKDHQGWSTVFKRPHVDYFLKQLKIRFQHIYVFTAAMPGYTDRVLDKLDPTGAIFSKRYYRDSCSINKTCPSKFVKLEMRKDVFSLPRIKNLDPQRYVFLDDNWIYTLEYPQNTIPISCFNNEFRKRDKGLLKALEFIRQLDGALDVRPVLDERFEYTLRAELMEQIGVLMDPIPIDYLP